MNKKNLYYFDIEVDYTYDVVYNLFKHQSVSMKYTKNTFNPNVVRIQPEPMDLAEMNFLLKQLNDSGAIYKKFMYEDPKAVKL